MNNQPRLALVSDSPERAEQRRRNAATLRAWRAKHPEDKARNAARQRAWAKKPENKAKLALSMRLWRAKHPEYKVRAKAIAEKNRAQIANNYYVRKYGLSIDAVRALLEAQGGVCAICEAELYVEARPRGHQGVMPNVDHDHITNTVRGVLCHYCNAGLGYFRDRAAILVSATKYLKKHERK